MNLKKKSVLAMLALLQTVNGWAVDKDMNPGMVPLGPFDFIPLLQISESHNDNIFYNNQNRKGSLITQIQGGGELALRRKLDRYALHYAFHSWQFHNSPADNYVDHNVGATAHFDFTRRNRLDFSSSLIYSHLFRGTIFFQGDNGGNSDTQPLYTVPSATESNLALLNEPDQYHRYDADIDYRYGRSDAKGNLGLGLGWIQTTYDNHPLRTLQWDNTQFVITPGFYWRLRPKTYLTTQIQNSFVDYPNSRNSYDLRRYLMGVTWDLSAKTKGSLRAGYYQQEFSSPGLQSSAGLTFDGHVQWLPLPYSILSFNLTNNIQPSIGGTSAKLQVYDANWKHSWPNRVTTNLSGAYREVTYQTGVQSTNNGTLFKFDVKYQMRSWLDIGVNYLRSDYQSVNNGMDYVRNSTQNIFMLYFNAVPQAGAY